MVEGFAAAPSLTRANALGQYLFVNGRPVRDKLIIGAVRAAYSDYLPRDRHPVVALFVTLDPRRGRRQCASGQDRGAVPQCRPGARADRACAEGGACPRRQAHRRQQRRRRARLVPPVVRAARQLGLAALAGLSGRPDAGLRRRGGDRLRRTRTGRVRRRHAHRGRALRGAAAPPICSTGRWARRGRRSTRPISCRRPATASSWSTSTPRMSASSMKG